MNLLLLEKDELDTSGKGTLRDRRAVHLIDVLGVQPGRTVRAGVVGGSLGTATVEGVRDGSVAIRWVADGRLRRQPPVDLLLALPRPKVMKRLWAQLAALGVGRIVLTHAARVERYYFDAHVIEPKVYRPLLLEGLAQAQRTCLPEVRVHRAFKPLIEDDLPDLFPQTTRLVAQPSSEVSLPGVVRDRRTERVLLAVGPEGGWTAYELELLHAHAFKPVSLGEQTLRSDTACVALLSVINAVIASA